MKSTGIVRKTDHLGRFVIPMELRRTLGIEENTPLEIFVDGENIVLRKYAPGCVICGSVGNLLEGIHVRICHGCAKVIAEETVKTA